MPTYEFYNTETEEIEEHLMSYKDLDKFAEDNPHLKKRISATATISQAGSTLNKTSGDWKNLLTKIKKEAGGNNEIAVNMDSQNLIQYTIDDIGGEVVKDNETYLLKDNKTLNNLVLSSTLLNPFKQTTGHNHSGQEEVYFFVNGTGYMTVDEEKIDVKPGTVVLIPDGAFHRVYNDTAEPLYFVCVFDGKRNH